MWKYLAALVVVVGLAFVVARQDQHAADQAAQKSAERHKTSVTIPNEQHPEENIENTARDGPRWYVLCLYSLFRWPNGTTTWAIVLTLMAIAEQTMQTARAANATQLATELAGKNIILQFRPKIIVRKVFLHDGTGTPTAGVPDAIPWTIDYVMVNTGGSRATIKRSGFEFDAFKDGDIPPRLEYKLLEPAKLVHLQPGEEKEFSVSIPSNLVSLFRMTGTRYRDSAQKTRYTYFWGCIQYADDAGIIRNTAVCRHYDLEIGKFTTVDNSDYEYAD